MSHDAQVAPALAEYFPVKQGVQVLWPSADELPALHVSQPDAPVPPWYFPAGHGVQLVAPVSEYLPARHVPQVAWLLKPL